MNMHQGGAAALLCHRPACVARWAPLALRLSVGGGFMQRGFAKLLRGPDMFGHILFAIGVPAPSLMAWATVVVAKPQNGVRFTFESTISEPDSVFETIAAALPEDALSALTTCRFCDERRCTDCPMEVFGSLEPAGGPVAGPWNCFSRHKRTTQTGNRK